MGGNVNHVVVFRRGTMLESYGHATARVQSTVRSWLPVRLMNFGCADWPPGGAQTGDPAVDDAISSSSHLRLVWSCAIQLHRVPRGPALVVSVAINATCV